MAKPKNADLKRLQKEIERLDPDGRFVRLDVASRTVEYSSEIRQHESIVWAGGDEEAVRAYCVCWLCTEGGYLPACLELEKPYSIGRPKKGAQLDILVKHPNGEPYALVEVKTPPEWEHEAERYIEGQLFNIAPHEPGASVLSFATVDLGKPIKPRAITIAYNGQRFERWQVERSSSDELPENYGEPVHEHFTAQGPRPLEAVSDQRDLDRLRKRLHDVLWRGSTPDNQVYEYVVKLFLTKIFDEKDTPVGERYKFQRYYVGNSPESPAELFSRISKRYEEAYNRYLNVSGREKPEPLSRAAFSAEQTAFVVELLQSLSLTSTDQRGGDLLGSFFEGITREGFKQSKGLFFTHLNLAVFMLLVLDVPGLALEKIKSSAMYSSRLPYIIDPSCGSGTFLLAAMYMVTIAVDKRRQSIALTSDISEFLEQKFPESHPNSWAAEFIFGLEQSELLAMSTKVNMVLHRDGNTHVYMADGLAPLSRYSDQRLKPQRQSEHTAYSRPVAESFDVVITNPPFSITVDSTTLEAAEGSFELARDTSSENLFLERWYQLLKPGGRLAAVLPESFFATQANLAARLFLLDHFRVIAVVSLPRLAFEPWTPTRTSLLFAEKRDPEEEQGWHEAKSAARAEVLDTLEKLSGAIKGLRSLLRGLTSKSMAKRRRLLRGASKLESLADLEALAESFEKEAEDAAAEGADDKTTKRRAASLRQAQRILEEQTAKRTDCLAAAEQAAERLGLELAEIELNTGPDEASEQLAAWQAASKEVNADAWAVREIAADFDYEFPVLSIEDIGYKRTKRREYARQNRLFTARSFADGSPIQNLNLAEGPWTAATDEQLDETAVAELQSVIRWR